MEARIKQSLISAVFEFAEGNGMDIDVTDYELGFKVDGIFFYAYVDVMASGETEEESDTGAWRWKHIYITVNVREIVEVEAERTLTVDLAEWSNDIERAIAV